MTLLSLEGGSFEQLLGALLAAGNAPSTGKTAQHAVAQCIAAMCQAAGYELTMNTVTSLMGQLQGTHNDHSEVEPRPVSVLILLVPFIIRLPMTSCQSARKASCILSVLL